MHMTHAKIQFKPRGVVNTSAYQRRRRILRYFLVLTFYAFGAYQPGLSMHVYQCHVLILKVLAVLLAGVALFDLGFTVAVRSYNHDTGTYLYLPPAAYVSSSINAVTMVTPFCLSVCTN